MAGVTQTECEEEVRLGTGRGGVTQGRAGPT